MRLFERFAKAQEKETMKGIYEELLNSSEDYLVRTIGQALGMTGGNFPDELDPENVQLINQALEYWKTSKCLMIRQAEIMDARDEYLRHELDEQRKFLDQQASLLREQSCILKDIQGKLEVGSIIKPTKTKAE